MVGTKGKSQGLISGWVQAVATGWLLLLVSHIFFTTAAFAESTKNVAPPAAFLWYKEKAEQGDVEAQYNLGLMCETGWGVAVDNAKAVRWYREAAKHGNKNAQLRLGMLYYLGVGAPQSDIKGEKWIRKAAKQGHPLADKINTSLFGDDRIENLSPKSILTTVRSAYLEDEGRASSEFDALIREAKQKQLLAEKEKEATTIRERRAQKRTEGPVKPGFSVAPEVERIKSEVPAFIGDAALRENRTLARGSIATIRLQAEGGLASAQYNLGRMYELGIKLPVDQKLALEWYEKSANQGYADAEYRMGIAFLYGPGAERDEITGRKWLSLAAKHNHPVAQKMMASLGNVAVGQRPDMSLAVHWYLERALAGDAQASFHLGKIYQYGWGVAGDRREAINWYQRANMQGMPEAKALIEQLKASVNNSEPAEPKNQFVILLENNGLPGWLAHPAVIVTILLLLFWPVFFRRKKKNEVREI